VASWQAVYWLVPVEEEAPDPELAWIGVEHAGDLFKTFDDVLPPSESWSVEMRHWGDYESHDIQAWLAGTHVAAIQVRIDLRQSDIAQFCARLAVAGQTLGAAFKNEASTDVMPDVDALLRSVKNSRAATFVADPQQYLSDFRDQAV
jgi:hypothetical protein